MEKEIKYAGFWARGAAVFLDLLVLSTVLNILQLFMGRGNTIPIDMARFFETGDDPVRMFRCGAEACMPFLFSNFSFLFILVFYWVVMTWLFGATIGKMAMGIRVVKSNLQPVTLGVAFIREFLVKDILYMSLFFISWLGYLWVSWDKKKQSWHDKIAHTIVIKERSFTSDVHNEVPAPPDPVSPVDNETLCSTPFGATSPAQDRQLDNGFTSEGGQG